MATAMVTLFKHHLWANLRLLDLCAGLDDRVLDGTVLGTAGSVRDTLAHITGAETGYVASLTGTAPPPREGIPFTSFGELRQRTQTNGEALIAFVETQDLEQIVRGEFHGRPYAVAVGIFLAHAITHAAEHRAHISTILTQQGIEPPVLDAFLYNRLATGE